MSPRLAALRRLAEVQAQISRREQWRLAQNETRMAAAAADCQALATFVDGGEASGGLADLALKQAQRLAARQAQLAADRELQSARTLEARRRLKQLDRMVGQLSAVEAEAAARKHLERLVEETVSRPSLP